MTVKDRVGRTRHVTFRVKGERPARRPEVQGAIRGRLAKEAGKDAVERIDPRLTVWTGEYGIVRAPHTDRDLILRVLQGITWMGDKDNPVAVEPLGTSGTVRGAKRFIPADVRPARERPRKGKR